MTNKEKLKKITSIFKNLLKEKNSVIEQLTNIIKVKNQTIAKLKKTLSHITQENNQKELNNEKLLIEILSSIDQIKIILNNPHNFVNKEDFLKGLILFFEKYNKNLSELGITILNPLGEKFDFNFHQALTCDNHQLDGDIYVTKVVRNGYLLNGKLIIPAQVLTSKSKKY